MATLSLLRPRQHPVGRHPERTRERILASALREFSDKGFAGARVDRIARRARINKRMLYHYFGNKASLFREILARKVRERSAWAVTAPDDAAESLGRITDALINHGPARLGPIIIIAPAADAIANVIAVTVANLLDWRAFDDDVDDQEPVPDLG